MQKVGTFPGERLKRASLVQKAGEFEDEGWGFNDVVM